VQSEDVVRSAWESLVPLGVQSEDVVRSAGESLVPLGVQSEVVGAGERARAVQTAERFRSGMLANVSRQLVGTCKVPLAAREVTSIRFLAYTTHTRRNSVTTTFFGCDAANTNLTFLLHAFLSITCQHAIHIGVASYGAPEHVPLPPRTRRLPTIYFCYFTLGICKV